MSKKIPLKLDRREATLGTSINTWGLVMGKSEEREPAKSIKLTTSISRAELCSLLRREDAGDLFFQKNAQGIASPKLKGIVSSPFSVDGEFSKSLVSLYVGIQLEEIAISEAKLTKLHFDPLDGGRSALELSVQWQPNDQDYRKLEHWLGREVKIEIAFGTVEDADQKQQQLPMSGDDAPATAADAIAKDDAEQSAAEGKIGTPEQERKKARKREQRIAQQLAGDRETNPAPRGRKGRNGGARAEA